MEQVVQVPALRVRRGEVDIRGKRALVLAITVAAALLAGASPALATFSDLPDSTWMTNGPVRAVIREGNTIYIGGEFTRVSACPQPSCDGYEVDNLAAIDASTGRGIPGFHPSVLNGSVPGHRVCACVLRREALPGRNHSPP
jgi:hypothetical protein